MPGDIRHVETDMTIVDGEVIDEVAAEIHGRKQPSPESIDAEALVVLRQHLQLDPAPRFLVLLELLQGAGQFLIQGFQIFSVFPVLAQQFRVIEDAAYGAFQHCHIVDGFGDVIPGAAFQRLYGVIQQADAGHHDNRCIR